MRKRMNPVPSVMRGPRSGSRFVGKRHVNVDVDDDDDD
jgi:hypothetical protein